MNSTRSTTKTSSFKLPSYSALVKMSLDRRTQVLLDWVKTQPKNRPVNYDDTRGCLLASFGQAITKGNASAGGTYFRKRDKNWNCKDKDKEIKMFDHLVSNVWGGHFSLAFYLTYGEAAQALQTYIEVSLSKHT